MQLLVDLEITAYDSPYDTVTFKKLVPIDISFSLQDTFEAKFESIVWNYDGSCHPITPCTMLQGHQLNFAKT